MEDSTNPHQNPTPFSPRVVFMGTPELAKELLVFLHEQHYDLVGVVTKAPKTVGRKRTLTYSPVHGQAEELSIPVLTPTKLDDSFFQILENEWRPDLIIVAAYGKILPTRLLALPRLGCLNIHYSLLPKHRGASPIQNALLAGEQTTGVTLMLMDEGLDTGPIIHAKEIPVDPDDTSATLTPKLNQAAKTLLHQTLPEWIGGNITPIVQQDKDATLCQLIERSDGQVVWEWTAQEVYNRYRAFTPWPGIYTFQKTPSESEETFKRIKLLEISLLPQGETPRSLLGQVLQTPMGIGVQASQDIILLHRIQPENRNPMTPADYLRGHADFIGSFLI